MPAPFFCALSPPHPAASRAPDFHPAQKNRRCPPSDALCPPSPLPSNAGDARLGRLSSARFATADFLPAFSPGGLFLFVLPQMRLHSSVPRRIQTRRTKQMRRGTDVFSLLRPFSHCLKGLPPFFGRRKSFCLCPLLSLPHKRPPSQSKVLCPKAPRQKTRPPNPRHKTESRLKHRVKKHGRRTRGTTAHF